MNDNRPKVADVLKGMGVLAAAGAAAVSLIEVAFADPAENIPSPTSPTAHPHISGAKFVRNWDRGSSGPSRDDLPP